MMHRTERRLTHLSPGLVTWWARVEFWDGIAKTPDEVWGCSRLCLEEVHGKVSARPIRLASSAERYNVPLAWRFGLTHDQTLIVQGHSPFLFRPSHVHIPTELARYASLRSVASYRTGPFLCWPKWRSSNTLRGSTLSQAIDKYR